MILPNNGNVIMTAEQAAQNAPKDVRVLPTRSLQAGLAAAVAFDASHAADENVDEMNEVLDTVATGAVTVASRDVQLNGVAVRSGSWLGLQDGEPVAGGDAFDEVAKDVLERLLAEPRGLITLLTGAEPPDLDGLLTYLRERHPELELEVHQGGQPHYPLLVAAE